MIKFIDFLFWHYYCFANRHKKIYWGDNVWQAIGMIYGTMIVPIVLIYKIIDLFIVNLPNLSGPGHIDSLIIMDVVSLPIFLFLNNRYYHNQKIIKDNFRIFRERWGDDPRQNKKGRIAIIIYTTISFFGGICLAIILGELNRRGLLDGCRLIQ